MSAVAKSTIFIFDSIITYARILMCELGGTNSHIKTFGENSYEIHRLTTTVDFVYRGILYILKLAPDEATFTLICVAFSGKCI